MSRLVRVLWMGATGLVHMVASGKQKPKVSVVNVAGWEYSRDQDALVKNGDAQQGLFRVNKGKVEWTGNVSEKRNEQAVTRLLQLKLEEERRKTDGRVLEVADAEDWVRLSNGDVYSQTAGMSLELKDNKFYDRVRGEFVYVSPPQSYVKLRAKVEESKWEHEGKEGDRDAMTEKGEGRKVVRWKDGGTVRYTYFKNSQDQQGGNFPSESEGNLLKAIMDIKRGSADMRIAGFGQSSKLLEQYTKEEHRLGLLFVVEHLLEIVRQRVLVGLAMKMVAARVRDMQTTVDSHVLTMQTRLDEEARRGVQTELETLQKTVIVELIGRL